MFEPTHYAYLAGVFDGEGWIGTTSKGSGKAKQLQMQVKMTDQHIVELFHETFGGTFYKVARTPSWKDHWKDQWLWRTSAKNARTAYNHLFPYLRLKRMGVEPL